MFNIFKKEPSREDRVDLGLPFNARIGSLVSIQASPLIEAEIAGSILPLINSKLSQPNMRVVAISRVRVSLLSGMKVFRFYLDKGDASEQQETFLQVTVDRENEPQELVLFTKVARIIPTEREEMEAYLGTNETGLGELNYDLWSGIIPDTVKSKKLLDLFGESEVIQYNRDVGDGEDFISPIKGEEERADSSNGEEGLAQSIVFMPYARKLAGTNIFEHLLITTEIVNSEAGYKVKNALHVDFMVGLSIDKSRVIIL